MRTISSEGTQIASGQHLADPKALDETATRLIDDGYIQQHAYLEMKHLDPRWLVTLYVYFFAFRRTLARLWRGQRRT